MRSSRHTEPYTIEQLAEKTGVPRRTIYFYIKEGLLPRPTGRGRNSRYGAMHVLRLEFIERTKDSMRLEAIRDMLRGLSETELQRRLEQFDPGQGETLFTETAKRYRGKTAAAELTEGDASPEEQELLRKVYEAQEGAHDPLRPQGAVDRNAARHRWDAPREPFTPPRVQPASAGRHGLSSLRRWAERRGKETAIEFTDQRDASTMADSNRGGTLRDVDWESIREVIERRDNNGGRDAPATPEEPTETTSPRAAAVPVDGNEEPRREAKGVSEPASPVEARDKTPKESTRLEPDTWHRVRISDDVEIHYRSSTRPGFDRVIQQLIRLARGLTNH